MRRAWAGVRAAASAASRHLGLTAAGLTVMNIALAAATQLLAAREPRMALLFQALMLGFTAFVFTVAIVSRTLIGPSEIRFDPRRTSNWWRSKVLGRGVLIRRQDFSPHEGQDGGPSDMPSLKRRVEPASLGALLGGLMRPKGLHPSAENIYGIFLESLSGAWDAVWNTVRGASFQTVLVASTLLILDAGLAWTGRLVETSSPHVARGLHMMELCVTMIILANGLGLLALGAACTFTRRGRQGLVLVLAGYALTVCPILIYTRQCGVLLPVLAGGAGIAAAMAALSSDDASPKD